MRSLPPSAAAAAAQPAPAPRNPLNPLCRGDASVRLLQGFVEMGQPTFLSQLSAQFVAVLVLDYYNRLFLEVCEICCQGRDVRRQTGGPTPPQRG